MFIGFIECLLDAKPSAESSVYVNGVKPFYKENEVQGGCYLPRSHMRKRQSRGETQLVVSKLPDLFQ